MKCVHCRDHYAISLLLNSTQSNEFLILLCLSQTTNRLKNFFITLDTTVVTLRRHRLNNSKN